jgi:hypothetical protein
MIGLTEHESDLAASGAGQARLIVASVALTNFLVTHDGMPPIGRPSIRSSFTMSKNDTDEQKADRLAEIAAWLGEQAVNDNGTFRAYRDFGGLLLGAHFTPRWIQEERAHRLLNGVPA